MHVLILGATGFIGRHVCARLLADQHSVTAAVRNVASAVNRFPSSKAARVDLNRMTAPADWQKLLVGVDAVVNCAGILQSGRGQSAAAIHSAAPIALFEACLQAGVRRIVHISAIGADATVGTEYARTKLAAETHLRGMDLDWTILRPSLVYASGSYGGTSLLRGLAGLPCFTPLVGDGGQCFQPIHADDLAETVARCLTVPALAQQTLEPAGPDTLSTRQILTMLRRWLDLPPARFVAIPLGLIRGVARIGDWLDLGPLRSTSLVQMNHATTASPALFAATIGFQPRSLAEALVSAPSHVQDRWHARLYFLRPTLTASLALLWLVSGLMGLVSLAEATAIAESLGLPDSLAIAASVGFSFIDLAIAVCMILGQGGRWIGPLQCVLVAGYSVGLGVLMPALWLDPLGRLLKNIPILGAIAIWIAIRDDR